MIDQRQRANSQHNVTQKGQGGGSERERQEENTVRWRLPEDTVRMQGAVEIVNEWIEEGGVVDDS
jgi:hypothetical protein